MRLTSERNRSAANALVGLASEKWRGFLELKGNRNAEAEEFHEGI